MFLRYQGTNNVPALTSAVTMAATHDYVFEVVQHPPYSRDWAPSDFNLFPNMFKLLAGNPFCLRPSADDDDDDDFWMNEKSSAKSFTFTNVNSSNAPNFVTISFENPVSLGLFKPYKYLQELLNIVLIHRINQC